VDISKVHFKAPCGEEMSNSAPQKGRCFYTKKNMAGIRTG